MKDDTSEVRPDERLDEGRLQDFLRGRLEGSERPLHVRQFGGGAANLTYSLAMGGLEYVPKLVLPSEFDFFCGWRGSCSTLWSRKFLRQER